MKISLELKVSAWLRLVASMAIIVLSIVACETGSLPSASGGSNPPLSSLDEIRLNMPSLTLLVGEKESLTATVLSTNAANRSVKWSSADSKVASVDPSNGMVTAVAVGKTVITATMEAGGKTASCAVTVTEVPLSVVEPTDINLTPPSLTLNIGDTDTLIVTVTPSNAARDINWKSSNPAVVVVDPNGKITAKGEGIATVYAVTVVGGKQASSAVTVKNPLPATIRPVLGHGYDITGRYAYSPDIKATVLDLDKLLADQRVKNDPNIKSGEFETIYGKDINEYMRKITANVSSSANANVKQVVSFASEVGATFDTERIKRAEYAFATSTSKIVAGAYNIENNGLDAYFTQEFLHDLDTMKYPELIRRYGTHVMLGGVLGGRADYHMSVEKKAQTDTTQIGAYANQSANVTYKGVTAGASTKAEVDTKFDKYFYTDKTITKTKVVGGNAGYGREIHEKQEYDNWIKSIEGNELWIDYYPKSLIPLSDLVTDSRRDALAQAIVAYCSATEIEVLPTYTLTIEQYPKDFGTLNSEGGQVSAKSPFAINATEKAGNKFIGWTVRVGDAVIAKPGEKSTIVTLNSNATIRANYLPANADYQGEIGKFSLNVPSWQGIAVRLKISYLKDDGTPTKTGQIGGNINTGKGSGSVDPGNNGIPDGSFVRMYSEIVGGTGGNDHKEGGEYFMYKKGSTKTASYTHTGDLVKGTSLTLDGVK